MCGIFGSITHKDKKLTYPERKIRNQIIQGIAVGMQERGSHGTGIAGVFENKTSIVKQALSAEEFVHSTGFKDLLRKNPNIIFGHTRFATVGEVSDKNTHPFVYGNIIGCHNGHVSNYEDVFEKHEVNGEVDSESIFFLLNAYKNDYRKAFSELYGTFALTWINLKNPNKVFIAKDGNPLYIIRVQELQTYFWASTELALRIAIAPFYPLKGQEMWELKDEEACEINTNFQIKKTSIKFMSYLTISKEKDEKEDLKKEMEEKNKAIIEAVILDKRKEKEDIEAIINKPKSIIPFNYLDHYGVPNPFMKGASTRELLEEHARLMNLGMPEMQNIIKSIDGGGCLMCDKWINFGEDGGVFWHQREHGLFCLSCQEELEEDQNTLIWMVDKDIEDIYEEVDAFEDTKKELACEL